LIKEFKGCVVPHPPSKNVLRRSGDHVLNHQLYGVDLMPDNISTVRDRLNVLPGTLAWDHIVCADVLTYDYGFEPQDPDRH